MYLLLGTHDLFYVCLLESMPNEIVKNFTCFAWAHTSYILWLHGMVWGTEQKGKTHGHKEQYGGWGGGDGGGRGGHGGDKSGWIETWLGDANTQEWKDDALYNCVSETCIILLTSVIRINSIKKKKQTNKSIMVDL